MKLRGHLGTDHTVSVKVLVEVKDDDSLNVEVSRHESILDTLHCGGNSSQNPHFMTRKIKFLALQVRHLETKVFD